MKAKTFAVSPAIPGYGARIWVRWDVSDGIRSTLGSLSRWGSNDKSVGEQIAFEYNPAGLRRAISYLESQEYKKIG